MRMLEKDPAKRYPDMEQVRMALAALEEPHLSVGSVSTTPTAKPPDSIAEPRTEQAITRAETRSSCARVGILGQRNPLARAEEKGELPSSIEVVQRFEQPSDLPHGSIPDLTWILGTDMMNHGRDVERWHRHGIPKETTLVCVDMRLTKQAASSRLFDTPNQLVGPFPVDGQLIAGALRWVSWQRGGGIECLFPGAALQVVQVRSSSDKVACIDALLDAAHEEHVRSRTLRQLAEICDEMALNALFHAPVDHTGTPRNSHLDRSSTITLGQVEAATLSWAFLENYIAISIVDPFGSLDPDTVYQKTMGGSFPTLSNDQKKGAGMGFQIMSQAASCLFVAVCPGNWCEVLALVPRQAGRHSTKNRSLCILKNVGLTTVKLGDRLRYSKVQHHGTIRISLVGEINESSDLAPIFVHDHALRLDLAEVARINSIGIRNWVDSVTARPPGATIVLERCSPAVVKTVGMVPRMMESVTVASFLAPYHCPTCETEDHLLVSPREIDGIEPLPCPCRRCGALMDFDEDPETFFAFLLDLDTP